MNRKPVLCVITLAMIAGTVLLLAAVPQKLGRAGVKAEPIPGSARWQIYLPERVLDFDSTNREVPPEVWEMLPKDTSITERVYCKPGAAPVASTVVLMGTDRTSIHKAEYCLQGEGLRLDNVTQETIHMARPRPYELPVIKIIASDSVSIEGKMVTKQCVYVYWYVADHALSNDRSGFGRMWSMARQLALTGVLQRWAYVRFYAFCDPGQEDATYAQIKRIITAAVPQFQLTPQSSGAIVATQ